RIQSPHGCRRSDETSPRLPDPGRIQICAQSCHAGGPPVSVISVQLIDVMNRPRGLSCTASIVVGGRSRTVTYPSQPVVRVSTPTSSGRSVSVHRSFQVGVPGIGRVLVTRTWRVSVRPSTRGSWAGSAKYALSVLAADE